MMRRTALTAICALLPLAAAEAAANLKDVKLGEHWYGPELKNEDLRGRVVLIEFWGIN